MLDNAVGAFVRPLGVAILGVALVVAFPAARFLARRYGCRPITAVGLVVATGLILAVTLPSHVAVQEMQPYAQDYFVRQLTSPHLWWRSVSTVGRTVEHLANIVLFLPIGFLSYVIWGRALKALVAGALLSVFIETVQNFTGRFADLDDITNNVTGAAIGLSIAVAIRLVRRLPAAQMAAQQIDR